MSADIFGEGSPHPSGPGPGPTSLPPPAPPVEPWPLAEKPVREERPIVVPQPEPEGHALRWALIVLVALLVLGYLVPAFSMTGRILPGTMVLGVDIGGQSETQAATTLRERLYAQTRTPIIVRQGMRRLTVDPQNAGLSLDVAATVKRAGTGFPTPGQVWNALTGTREIRPVVSVDKARLRDAVARDVASPLEEPGQEGGLAFKGLTPVPVFPKLGREIDRNAVADEIQKAYLSADVMVVVPTLLDQPRVSIAEVKRTLEWARQAVAGPVTLTNGTTSVPMPPGTIARHLTFAPDGATLRPRFDAAAALAELHPGLIAPARAARDATYVVTGGTPVLIHAKAGERVDTGRLAQDVIQALGGGSRTIPVSVIKGPPAVADADAARLGVAHVVGRFTTRFDCCAAGAGNIAAAARIVDDHVVRPGETFSFNAVLGERTAAAGFTGPAPTMIRGRVGSDVPGMSQFATTLLNAAIRGGFRVADYTPPDVHLPQLPAGTEAAVGYPEPDMVWKNDSPYGVLIQASATATSVTVRLWSTKRYDVEIDGPVKGAVVSLPAVRGGGGDCAAVPGRSGFTAEVTRILRRDGATVDRQTFRSVYQPQAQIICP